MIQGQKILDKRKNIDLKNDLTNRTNFAIVVDMELKELRRVADEYHGRQQYGPNNYLVHLEEVRDILTRFGFTIKEHPSLHFAAYLHDLFEDTDFTRTMAQDWGIDPDAIDWAWKITDEEGQTREERKAKTYKKMEGDSCAIALKLADRIANVESGGKLEMYKKEHPEFKTALYNPSCDPRIKLMWDWLDSLLLK